ncbi:MAG TPA: hypothetical protein VF210_13245 [Pseudomonadales bacterium]
MRRLAPFVGAVGAAWLRTHVRRRLRNDGDGPAGFFVPLAWVEAVWGPLPERRLSPEAPSTILADWVECGGVMRMTTDYFLGRGDWADLVRSTDGDPVREEARQLAAAGLEYRQTEAYQSLIDALHRPGPRPQRQGRLLDTEAAVDAYFERFVRLFHSIERHGVLSQPALRERGIRFNDDRGLGVAVDASGRLHRLQGGNHRWAIAQVLGVPEVPVELRLIHAAQVPDDVARYLGL